MDNETAILALATSHLKAAEQLLQIQQYHQALYLAGYAVELTLKARIVRLLNLPDLYSGKYENEIIKIYRTHDFKRLILLSGLKTQLDTFTARDPILANHWNNLATWSEKIRYENSTQFTKNDTQDFIDSVKNICLWINTQP